MNVLKGLIFAALVAGSGAARAQLDCVVPTREEGFEAARPGAAALRKAARAAAAVSQGNAVFMAGNKPIRVRTTISYYGLDRLAASVITTAYNEKAWLPDGCRLSPYADRGGGLSDGQLALYINDPESLFGGQMGDASLRASRAPRRMPAFAGFPVFAIAGNEANPRVLLSRNDYVPWIPVPRDEISAWHERQLQPAPSTGQELDEAAIERIYLGLKEMNPAEAAKVRTRMLSQLGKMRAEAERQKSLEAQARAAQRSALQEQAADPRNALVKLDPGYPDRDPGRIHLIVVSIAPQPKTDPEYAWQQASHEALDLAALAGLLD